MSGTTLNIRGNLMIEGKSEMSGVLKCKRIERPDDVDGKMTGEKFLGRYVYYKEWDGDLTSPQIEDFFPSTHCYIVAFGGDYFTTFSQVHRVPLPHPNYVEGISRGQGTTDLLFEALHDTNIFGLRLWVKYTDDYESGFDGDGGIAPGGEDGGSLSGSSSSSGTGSGSGSEEPPP
jgi:uncharacterized membrane protein YgcG